MNGTHHHEDQHEHHHEHGGHATHGMLLVGEETVYLSHLPMFTDPDHSIQAILEATFTDGGGDPQAAYVEDRKRTGTKLYTFEPKKFALSDLVSADPRHHPPRRSFRGRIFQGHFERGGTPLVEDVVVEVTNVVHFRVFDPEAPGLPELRYLLFGKGSELFLAHLITKPPDFDQVLSVQVSGHEFNDQQLRRGIQIAFPGRANSLSERIREGEQVTAQAHLAGGDGPETVEIQVEARTEFYFEEGELRVPADFDPTEEERAAGFG